MHIYAFANQKGGVSKTTTVVNLAHGIATAGYSVLIADLDPQANASFATLGPQPIEPSSYNVLMGGASIDQAIQNVAERLDILPSHIDLAGAEVELIQGIGGQTRLSGVLAGLPYDYILIDCPPSLGLLTINALAACDKVIIPVSTGIFALQGIAKLQTTIDQVRQHLNKPSLSIGGVICTMVDNTNTARDAQAAVREHFGDLVFDTTIPRNVKVEEAHSRQQSVLVYAPTSTGAIAYQQLTQEFIDRG